MIVTGAKVLIASVIACFIPRTIFWLHPMNKFFVLIVSAIVSTGVYLLVVKIMKIDEINDLVGLFKRKLKKA